MKLVPCPSLVRACGRTLTIPSAAKSNASDPFSFAVLADPQLGLLESYVEKRPLPHHWDREVKRVNKAIELINKLSPKPSFVVACGDLVHAFVGDPYREPQTTDLMNAFHSLDPEIALVTLPGNHDVSDSPTTETIKGHTDVWGDDYYTFRINQVEFIVLNSQFLYDDSKCRELSKEFHVWLDNQLTRLENETGVLPIVLQHIPFFERDPDEPDDYFNIPSNIRFDLMTKMYSAGVRNVFAGHLHHNSVLTWNPPAICTSNSSPLNMITSSSVSVPLSTDPPGLRLVRVCKAADQPVQHAYWTLDALEALLLKGEQPNFT